TSWYGRWMGRRLGRGSRMPVDPPSSRAGCCGGCHGPHAPESHRRRLAAWTKPRGYTLGQSSGCSLPHPSRGRGLQHGTGFSSRRSGRWPGIPTLTAEDGSTGEQQMTTPTTSGVLLAGDQALTIAQADATRVYRDLSVYQIQLALEPDGWHVDYDL